MVLVICVKCGFAVNQKNIVWNKYRNYQAWCITCLENEAEELFNG